MCAEPQWAPSSQGSETTSLRPAAPLLPSAAQSGQQLAAPLPPIHHLPIPPHLSTHPPPKQVSKTAAHLPTCPSVIPPPAPHIRPPACAGRQHSWSQCRPDDRRHHRQPGGRSQGGGEGHTGEQSHGDMGGRSHAWGAWRAMVCSSGPILHMPADGVLPEVPL